MPSFKKFYKENRKKAIQSQKNSLKLLQLLMILCSYNFIKFSMCSYNFNVAVRISINLEKKEEVPDMLRRFSNFLRDSFETYMQLYTRDLF